MRTAYFPYYDYRWRGLLQTGTGEEAAEMEITNGTTRTDKNGKFKIDFDLIPDLSLPKETKPVFTYTVYADVVDVTGETHSAQTSVRAGYVALVANVNLPEIVNNLVEAKYNVSTTNLNGQFEKAKVEIEIHKLKNPDRIFRNRLWGKPDEFLLTKEDYYENFRSRYLQ